MSEIREEGLSALLHETRTFPPPEVLFTVARAFSVFFVAHRSPLAPGERVAQPILARIDHSSPRFAPAYGACWKAQGFQGLFAERSGQPGMRSRLL